MNWTEVINDKGEHTGIYIIEETDNAVLEETTQREEILVEDRSLEEVLNSKTMMENLEAGVKIMGVGMASVFGVLTILYVAVKIMGHFAKGKKLDETN